MVYGVLKASKNKKSSSGVNEVKLEGNAENDAQVDHIIQFASPAIEDSWDTDAKTERRVLLHRLAAKNSIQEKQGDVNELGDSGPRSEKAKSYVISISKSTNVVSKFTSFVAVDKDSFEPVSGPLQKQLTKYASMPVFGGGQLKLQSANLPWGGAFSSGTPPLTFSAQSANVWGGGTGLFSAPPPPPPGAISTQSANVWGGGTGLFSAPPPPPPGAISTQSANVWGSGSLFGALPPPPPYPPSGAAFAQSAGAVSAQSKGFSSSLFGGSLKKGKGEKAAHSHAALKSVGVAAPEAKVEGESGSYKAFYPPTVIQKGSYSAPPVSAHNQKKKGSQSALSVISLQKASGSWDLTDQLVSLCDASRSDLIKGCLKGIAADTAEGKRLWATALALVLLMGKYPDQKDEWEMIAEKGKKYLKKNLPGSLTLDQVLESAATAVGVWVNTGL